MKVDFSRFAVAHGVPLAQRIDFVFRLDIDCAFLMGHGSQKFRNRDQEFERALEKESADRRVSLKPEFRETGSGFTLSLTDEDVLLAVNMQTSFMHPPFAFKEAATPEFRNYQEQVINNARARRAGC